MGFRKLEFPDSVLKLRIAQKVLRNIVFEKAKSSTEWSVYVEPEVRGTLGVCHLCLGFCVT